VVVKPTPVQRAAQKHKVTVASHAGGTRSNTVEKPKIDPTQVGGIKLKGFTEDDFK
jgi:hypothetical protein